MYPSFLVVATSVAGVLMTQKLVGSGVVGEMIGYLMQCVYVAKLAMLVLPEVRGKEWGAFDWCS
jgi:hypothetical protein